ncbi:chromosome partitioning protein ParA [Vibrio sp. 10N.237.312.B06]|uniref:chromosome partitioning protein ParA n=1 Tax=Vibrio sp. 10N.237.312.B06 TaxID=3229974 RepID=UPI00355339F7
MSISEIKELFQIFSSLGLGVIIGAGFVFLILKSFLPSYLSSKATNLATKEDIGAITREVELVRSGYAGVLEELKNNHQLKLASIEREKLLKKEVYLESVEALSRCQNILASMSDLNVSDQTISSIFSSSSALISKINLVGSEATVKNLTNFMGEVAAAYMTLLTERAALSSRKAHIELLETFRQKHNNEIERCLTIMKNMNLEGISDQGAWDRLNRSFNNESVSRDKVSSEIDANWAVQNESHAVFSQLCMSEFFRVNDLTPHLLLSIRSELDLEFDESEYLTIHIESTKKAKLVFERFMNNLREVA